MKSLSPSLLHRAGNPPIESVLADLAGVLSLEGRAVLVAPPGAGKTTIVPLALLDAEWLGGKRILMLEPRRVATRAAARRMAWLLNEPVGERVGFRVRNESVVGEHTRIEVVTEGILTRILQRDAALEEYGAVIFDEFHERNLHGDVGLALTLQTRALIREDLRVLVMSATLDTKTIADVLDGASVVRAEGRTHPVDIRYAGLRTGQDVEGATVSTTARAFRDNAGDLLVFLPGIGEINRAASRLREIDDLRNAEIHVLHSSVPAQLQDSAINPAQPGVRKIVLATSIAETSITIDGVTVVVDSGLSRVPRYSPRTGLTRLETVKVSKASAEQRAGRAGRTAPGVCYRIWDEGEQHALLDRWLPEIVDADLVPLVLDLAVAGIGNPSELRWIDAPPDASVRRARELLRELGAIEDESRVTPHGREMNRLALHPRLAHMVLRARDIGLLPLACDLAALLEEGDILPRDRSSQDSDLRSRVQLLKQTRSRRGQAPSGAISAVLREADRLRKATGARDAPADERACGLLLAFAYPDRIAMSRDSVSERFILRNGTGAALPSAQSMSASTMIVVADIDGRKPEGRIWLAAPVDVEDIVTHFGDQIEAESAHEWNDESQSVRSVRRERLGALVLRESLMPPTDEAQAAEILVRQLLAHNLGNLPWSASARAVRERIAFLRHRDSSWPDVSDAALRNDAEEWLTPHLHGVNRIADLKKLDMAAILLARLDWRQRKKLDELAPSHMEVPTGSRIPIDYSDPDAPMISVRLQEMFGLSATPRIMGGAVPVTVQLLSPAQRPVQTTTDLAGFWRTSYFDVRKEMRGRYPKHHWPENPLEAEPTRRAKRRPG